MNREHTPVLLQEVLNYLRVKKGKKYIDATVGFGGHALEIVKKGGIVLGIDKDVQSLERLKFKIQNLKFKIEVKNLKLVHGSFQNIGEVAEKYGFGKVSGILFDLGLSSWQIEKSGRGFSYLKDEALDMRADNKQELTAGILLNTLSRNQLYAIFTKFGEEQHSWRIANAVCRARPLITTKDLKSAIKKAVKGKKSQYGATARIFQAVRVAVNDEIRAIKKALPKAFELLEESGKLILISFHSLEDRVVKKFYLQKEKEGKAKILTKKPETADKNELKINTRAKSAKLRVLEKL